MSYSPVNESWQELYLLDPEIRNSRILADLEQQFIDGNKEALMDAVFNCLNANCPGPHETIIKCQPVPEWVRLGFTRAWGLQWDGGRARSLGEAFEIKRPKGWHSKRARKDVAVHVIWQTVLKYMRTHNVPIGRDLFEAVAEELTDKGQLDPQSLFAGLKINGTDVQEAYYAHKVTKISKESC